MALEIHPLKTVDAVLSWKQSAVDQLMSGSVPLSRTIRVSDDAHQILVCHDMRGGYLEDRFVEGSTDIGYRFYHWQNIDLFVYFSHHLVTIPPPGWINAAHRHGVKVMGTFITEWDDGKAACAQFLQTSQDYRGLANKMVDIMKYYQFDGWLVNIENVIEKNMVNNLKEFVAFLTLRCHAVHEGSKVIWYDSVTETGELKWQDELNESNRLFFDVCDGIFLNYCWNETKLHDSYRQAAPAGREMDVFVGVDVFGRGCPGGGGYNTCEAMAKIEKAKLSAAIFAPGWVYETQGEKNFDSSEDRFWRLLRDYCPLSQWTSPLLSTSFCRGYGGKYFCQGQVVHKGPWYNMSIQQLQPMYTAAGHSPEIKVEFTDDDGYLGGGCLVLTGCQPEGKETVWCKLFQMKAMVSTPLYVTFTVKSAKYDKVDPILKLILSRSQQHRHVYLNSGGATQEVNRHGAEAEGADVKVKVTVEDIWINPLTDDVKESGDKFQWKTLSFCVEEGQVSGWTLDSVSIGLGGSLISQDKDTGLKLGQIQIMSSRPSLSSGVCNITASKLAIKGDKSSPDLSQGGDNLKQEKTGDTMFMIKWQDTHAEDVLYYNVYHGLSAQSPRLVKHSVTQACTVAVGPQDVGGTVTIQTVTSTCCVVPLSECPSVSLPMVS